MWYGPLTRRQTLTSAEHLPAPFGPLLPTWYCIIRYHRSVAGNGTAPLLRQKLLRCPCLAPMFSQARHGAADPPLLVELWLWHGGHGHGPRSPELKPSHDRREKIAQIAPAGQRRSRVRRELLNIDRSELLNCAIAHVVWRCPLRSCQAPPPADGRTLSSLNYTHIVVVGLTHMAPG